jgi:hypothetical protein|nr:MAG TPA: Protein of unknown function (DUF3800) [Caudoviricetes sp.]
MFENENSLLEATQLSRDLTYDAIESIQENQTSLPFVKTQNFSSFIIFSDETGDVGLKTIDQNYPYFAINFCIFKKADYLEFIKDLKDLKITFFNSDLFIFHEVEIAQKYRKMSNYKFSQNRSQQLLTQMSDEQFIKFISNFETILKKTDFRLVTAVIDKRKVKVDVSNLKTLKNKQEELYSQVLRTGLYGVFKFLLDQKEQSKKTCVVFEEFGNKETKTIKSIFYDFCNEFSGKIKQNVSLEYEVAPKKSNNEGLQLADMTAKASLKICVGENADRTCELIKSKLVSRNGNFFNEGLFKVAL